MDTTTNQEYDSADNGNLTDYSHTLYLVYFEVAEVNSIAQQVILQHIGADRESSLKKVDFGYEVALPVQVIPEIVRDMSAQGVAVYQVVRKGKLEGLW